MNQKSKQQLKKLITNHLDVSQSRFRHNFAWSC